MIRKYRKEDKLKIIKLLRENTPEFFDPSEEELFENYLDNKIEDSFVYEKDSKIIGAGGINYFSEQKTARISWDMVHPNSQRSGVGKKITQYRINHLSKNQEIKLIIVRTTQLVYRFYEKMGFALDKIEKDFWAKNFDLYQMKMSNENNVTQVL